MSADTGSSRDSVYGSAASGRWRTHTVAPGETVYHIARQYGVSPGTLMAANGLSDARNLAVGQILVIPGHPLAAASITGVPDEWLAPRRGSPVRLAGDRGGALVTFRDAGRGHARGDRYCGPGRTPVRAADNGGVIFAGRLHGYGNVVIVQHDDGYVTVYGHNQRNLVREGEQVTRGEQIAELGATGRASGPNLHFEVRYNNHPQNPIRLPARARPRASGISFARNTAY